MHKIKYLPKCHDLTTQVVRQGGAKGDGWTSVKEGGSEKTSEQQKNRANDDQPNTNVVFYKVRQTFLGFAVTKAIIGLETSSSQAHSMLHSPPMINLFQCLWILCLLVCFQVCSIQTTNRLWHFLFLVGSQLGDEELLGLYFMVNQCARYLERTFLSSDFAPKIWMWCLDSAVGRKVVLVWTLVSTFPHSVHLLTDYWHPIEL